MKKIFKIAKLELSILFYSPVAWLVLTIFMIQSGMRFLGMFQSYQEALSLGIDVNKLTFSMFPGLNGLFDVVQQNLYLYIPLLTMGLMSRETSSGSIKLLLSSPVKIREIILGKYLAIVGYGFLLIVILAMYAVVGLMAIKDADISLVISGLFGLFLLICTYAAIGLFMSSLTSYQVVAAISTLAVFAALKFVGSVGQDINFIRDLTYFLSITGRADDILKGLITSKDVLYFIIIIVLFLYLCILRLKGDRESKHWTLQTGKYALLVCLALLLGYVSSRPHFIGYIDMTATNSRTLTKNSQDITKQINGPLQITTYVNLLDQNVYFGLPGSRNFDLAKFEQYQRFIPGLKFKYVYYYDITDLKNNRNMVYQGDLTGLNTHQVAEKVAANMGLDLNLFMPSAEIHKIIDLKPENNSLVRVLEYKGKKSFLRLYDGIDQFPGETEITAAIKRLLVPVPKVAFVTGNNERSIDKKGDRNYQMISGMKRNRNALINQGFDVVDIDLNKQEIPDNLAVLVLGDPTIPLDITAQQKVAAYLDKGGNMMITGEPGRQSLLNPLLKPLGVQLKGGRLVRPSKDDAPDVIFGQMKAGNAQIAMPGSVALEYTNSGKFKADSLILSPVDGWNKRGQVDLTSTDIKYIPASGDQKGIFPIALALTRTVHRKEQRILISGDADFISNAELSHPKGFNMQFITRIFKWFSYGAFPVDTSRPATTDDDILISRKEISTLKLTFLGIVPVLLIALGAFVLIKRKRN